MNSNFCPRFFCFSLAIRIYYLLLPFIALLSCGCLSWDLVSLFVIIVVVVVAVSLISFIIRV